MPAPRTDPDLPPFDPQGRCPKCASASVRIRHEPITDHFACTVARDRSMPLGGAALQGWRRRWDREHLERTCERCGYGWAEAVSAPADPPA
jgi:hypothetical protein